MGVKLGMDVIHQTVLLLVLHRFLLILTVSVKISKKCVKLGLDQIHQTVFFIALTV